jgi:hypothetical protein
MTAESFWVGAFLGAAAAICCYELGRALADLSAVRVRVREVNDSRPSSRPAFREAMKAKNGGWNR